MLPDSDLLRRYVESHSQEAFHALVQRHAGLVYAAAVRQTHGDRQLAEDVGQRVFTQLARKAGALTMHPTLVGWLHRATRFAAIDAMRSQQRRQTHEREAETMSEMSDATARIEWEKLQPLLDEALDGLRDTDRTVVLLRFFEGHSFAEVGASVGLSENAARMRVERALEKLRSRLVSRGCTSTAAVLGAAMATQATATAPAGWATAVAAAALTNVPVSAGAAATGWGIFAMNKITVALITGVAAAGVTASALSMKTRWTRQENATLRAEIAALRQLRSTHEAAATGAGPSLGELADRERLQELNARLQQYNSGTAKRLEGDVKQAKPALQNRGNTAPMEAIETFAWACYTADAAALARLIHFDGDARQVAEAQLAKVPAFLREQYKTPEELCGFFLAADCLVAPPPSDPELLKLVDPVFLQSDRFEMRKKGESHGRHQYQWTPEGWKFALKAKMVQGLAEGVLRDNPMPTPEPAGSQ